MILKATQMTFVLTSGCCLGIALAVLLMFVMNTLLPIWGTAWALIGTIPSYEITTRGNLNCSQRHSLKFFGL